MKHEVTLFIYKFHEKNKWKTLEFTVKIKQTQGDPPHLAGSPRSPYIAQLPVTISSADRLYAGGQQLDLNYDYMQQIAACSTKKVTLCVMDDYIMSFRLRYQT